MLLKKAVALLAYKSFCTYLLYNPSSLLKKLVITCWLKAVCLAIDVASGVLIGKSFLLRKLPTSRCLIKKMLSWERHPASPCVNTKTICIFVRSVLAEGIQVTDVKSNHPANLKMIPNFQTMFSLMDVK